MDGKLGVFQGTRNNLNDRGDKVTVRAYYNKTLSGKSKRKNWMWTKKRQKMQLKESIFSVEIEIDQFF